MSSDYEALAQYFNKSASKPGPGVVDIAKFIVLNAENQKPLGPGILKGNSPSLMGRVFDILSRPNYAVANFSKGLLKGKPNFADFLSGLSGTQKITFSNVLAEHGVSSGLGRGILGLGLDIGLDPTTYIGGAGIVSKLRGAGVIGKGEKAAKDILEIKPRSDIEIPRDEIPVPFRDTFKSTSVEPIKVGLPSRQLELDLPNLKHKTPDTISSPLSLVEKVIPGQLSLKFPNFKVSEIRKKANQTIEDLPVNLEKIVPVPKPVPGPQHSITANTILQKFIPLSTGHIGRNQMAKLYNEAIKLATSKSSKVRLSTDALKTYIAAEQKLRQQGFKPLGDVWLSDTIIKVGPDAAKEFSRRVVQGSPTWQAVEDLKASAAIQDAGPVQRIAEGIGQTKVVLETGNQLSDAQLGRVKDLLGKIGKESAKSAAITPSAENAAVKLIKAALMAGESRAQIAVQQTKYMLDDIVSTGKANPKINHTLTLALEKDLGTIPAWAATDNNAVEFMMGRIATWWGQKDLRPLSLNQIASSTSTAFARGRALDRMFKDYSQAQRAEVFRLAQGIPGIPTSPQVQVLTQQITRMMENLVGRASGTSVVTRAGVSMDLLNKWMKQYKVGFLFQKGKVKNYITGEIHDLSKGKDWLDTWKHMELSGDYKTYVFKLQQALEQATREKALFDEIGERFGSIIPGKGFKTKIKGYPYLEGYYFTDDIAKQLPRVIRDWTTPGFLGGSGVLGLYDRVLSMWKAGVTIYRPGHHIRNMAGDIYLGWMDGVNSARPYLLAARVQRVLKNYTDLLDIDQLVDVGAANKNFRTPRPNEILFTNKSGVSFTAEQIGAVAHQKGLLEHAKSIEDIIDLGEGGQFKPFGGKVQAVARGASELQSHNTRLAHFIDKVMKSYGSNLPEIFEQASRRARKWHPTGLDLTTFEKKYFRRVIPFYSWIRKSTPLLLEGLVMNPGKAVIPSKVYDAIQESTGIETPGRADPFPVDQMFPEWIRAQGVGPISLPDGFLSKISSQMPPGYVMGGVGLNPLSDLITQLENPGRSVASSLTPAAKIPIELSSGRKLFTGEPVTGVEARPGAMEQYAGEQIPIYSAFQGITGITPLGGGTKKVTKSGGPDLENLINYLISAGIKGTGPYIQQARYEKKAPQNMQNKIKREELLNQLRGQL